MKNNSLRLSALTRVDNGWHVKRLGLFVVMLIVLESCSVYSKTSISAAEARDKGRVRVVDFTSRRFVFDNIELKDSIYYGVRKGQALRLYQEQPMEFYLRNPKASNKATFLAILIPTLVITNIIVLTDWSKNSF
jgi:hypothetical protein